MSNSEKFASPIKTNIFEITADFFVCKTSFEAVDEHLWFLAAEQK